MKACRPVAIGLFFLSLVLLGGKSYGQMTLTVENVQTKNFPELRFDLRSSENLVAGKASLVVKDNYVAVPRFKITAGKKNATGTAFVVTYTVLDPDRLDGTTTFDYRGQSVTTTYLVKQATDKKAEAYPKPERTDNTIFYVIGGLGILAGVAGFLLARRKRPVRHTVASAKASLPPRPSAIDTPLPPPPVARPVPARAEVPVMPPPQRPSYEEAYKPPPQHSFPTPPPAFVPPPSPAFVPPQPAIAETMLSPGMMPTIELRLGDHRRVTLTLTGTRQLIGRAPECDLLILHPTVSKIHAAVWLQNGNWWMEDLGSTNGTYIDGQRITRTAVHTGGKLFFGQVAGVFLPPSNSESFASRTSPSQPSGSR